MQEFRQGNQETTEDEEERRLRRQIQIIKEESGIKTLEKWAYIVIILMIISGITIGYIKYKAFQTFKNELKNPTFIQEIEKERAKNPNKIISAGTIMNVNPPDYPQSAINRGKQGIVIVRATKTPNEEKLAQLVKSSNDRDLDEAAITAGKRAVIYPAETISGRVETAYQFEVHFALEQQTAFQKPTGIVMIKNIHQIKP